MLLLNVKPICITENLRRRNHISFNRIRLYVNANRDKTAV